MVGPIRYWLTSVLGDAALFAALVAAAEREACAASIESPVGRRLLSLENGPGQLAAFLRARGAS